MSLWVKRAQGEAVRNASFMESVNRVFPMPFEERRTRVGMVKYRTWRWIRAGPYAIVPLLLGGIVLESRDSPHENVFTALHLWLADQGLFRHDTIKALNPAFETERMALEAKFNDRSWRFTGGDQISERELREFIAINVDKSKIEGCKNPYGL
jgi:hypothetical protein